MPPDHIAMLRHSLAVARRARQNGKHPFGAILVDAEGRVLMEIGRASCRERV